MLSQPFDKLKKQKYGVGTHTIYILSKGEQERNSGRESSFCIVYFLCKILGLVLPNGKLFFLVYA